LSHMYEKIPAGGHLGIPFLHGITLICSAP
jgi:hypothetical protein